MTRILAICFLFATLGVATASVAAPQAGSDQGIYVLGQDASSDVGPDEPASLQAAGDTLRRFEVGPTTGVARQFFFPCEPVFPARIRAPPVITY